MLVEGASTAGGHKYSIPVIRAEMDKPLFFTLALTKNVTEVQAVEFA